MKRLIRITFLILVVAIGIKVVSCKTNHFNRFEHCMETRGYDYSDGECEVCWEDTKFKYISE